LPVQTLEALPQSGEMGAAGSRVQRPGSVGAALEAASAVAGASAATTRKMMSLMRVTGGSFACGAFAGAPSVGLSG
jgi:hypothetical protein